MKENVLAKANALKGVNDITMKGEIVVFGSTYMANFPFYELVNKCKFENAVYNRSIEGLTIDEAIQIAEDCVIKIIPDKIFLALGEEDSNDPNAIQKYNALVHKIRSELPFSKLYLICLTGSDEYTQKFNQNIQSLCDNKQVKYIKLVSPAISQTALFRARFKQLSSFFRNKPLSMPDAFAMAEL